MEHGWQRCARSYLLWTIAVCLSPRLSAAPPKPTTESVPSDQVEVPAVPYLTLALIRDPAVHAELNLTPEQIAGVQKAVAEVDESFWRLRDVPLNECAPQLEALLAKLLDPLQDQLTAAQRARFDQILLQRRSWRALTAPDVSKTLGLSNEQTIRLLKALQQALKEREALEQEIAEQTPRLQEQARAKLQTAESRRFTSILTPGQREKYRQLLGDGFDFSLLTPVGCLAPELRQVDAWINTDPVTLQQLRGKVVVFHFWAFGCINCIRNLPHYQSWHEQFGDQGVVILGVHTPETQQERKLESLQRNVEERNIEYPVIFDAASENWKAWGNHMWPSVYLIDKQGRIRNWWYGELNWNGARGEEFFRRRIQELRAEK